jgi:acetate kinase
MGMSPQSGLPQNNRVGDLDPFALPLMMEHSGLTLTELLQELSTKAGLLGLSGGLSGDIRDIESAADAGNADAKLALDVYVAEIRRQMGGMMMAMGGLDAVVFTGGIGENGKRIRTLICDGLQDLGISLCQDKNQAGSSERRIDNGTGRVELWIIPTNEEIVVARQTVAAILKT